MTFTLKSPAFMANGKMPPRYSCEGANVSPPLEWSGAPDKTRSFALVCSDPDAPSGTFYHWGVYNIPANIGRLPDDFPAEADEPSRQAINDYGRPGYGGVCPPRAHGPHHYRFHLYALNIDNLPLRVGAHCRDLEQLAREHSLAETELVGLYERR